jgi:hypothetical protein
MRILSLATLLAAFAAAAPAAAEDCPPLHIIATLDIVPTPGGRVLVPATVGGEERYLVLGTASPMSSVTPELADSLHLAPERLGVRFIDIAGHESNLGVRLPSFALGGMQAQAQSLRFLLEAQAGGAPAAGGKMRSGVLGADFLRGYDIDLDFGADKMQIISPEHCAGKVVYWKTDAVAAVPMHVRDDGKVVFDMTLDGHTLETVLNTGVPSTFINQHSASEIFGIDNTSPGNQPAGSTADGTPLVAHRFQSLGVEGLAINNPSIVLMPDKMQEALGHIRKGRSGFDLHPHADLAELALGMSTLKHLHVYIAYREQTIYVSPAAAP